MKKLIVNADDFGFTRGVNEGILRAHREGIVTASTLMADGPAFAHAVEAARATPSLDVGVHLVLWPAPGVQPGAAFEEWRLPRRVPWFVARALWSSSGAIEAEFCRQVQKVRAAGLCPSHLDTHKHLHLLPWVMKAVVAVARRFAIPWVRRPLYRRQATARGLRVPDYLVGFRLTGTMNRNTLLRGLSRLRPGLSELVCHPGLFDQELERAPTCLKQQRQVELEALTDPEVRRLLERQGVELTSYRDC